MWITPLPPSLSALGEGSHGSILNGNYAPNRLTSACKPTLEGAESTIAVGRQVPVGRVRLDLPGAFGRRHVLPPLLDLTRAYPKLDLSIMFSERTVDILSEGTDLAVRIGELRDDPGLSARRLGSQRLVVCASPEYLDRYGAPEEPAGLLRRDCIVGMRSDRRPTWLLMSKDGATVSHGVNGRHEFSDGQAMVDAVLAGGGLSQLPTWLIGEHLKSGQLVQVLTEFAGAEMPIHAVWPTSRYLKPKVRILIDALVQTAKQEGSGFRTPW